MNSQEKYLLEEALSFLHKLYAISDAEEDFRPMILNFVNKEINTPKQSECLEENQEKCSTLKFTQKEISQMPKNYQKSFTSSKSIAHVRKIRDVYEIRCTINGIHYSASSKNLSLAKEKFIKKLSEPPKKTPVITEEFKEPEKDYTLFGDYCSTWLELQKPYIKEITYIGYLNLIDHYIEPALGSKLITDITNLDIQTFINSNGNTRTTEKIYTLLGTIFKYAVPSAIPYSPMHGVRKPLYTPIQRQALTYQEEFDFIKKLFESNNPYRYTFVVILYAGLRRSEVKTAKIDDNFITVVSAKQRKGRPELERKIPISPMLRQFFPLPDLPCVRDDTLSSVFKTLCPNHNLHELRHTFNSRARTLGIPKLLANHWLGQKPGKDDVNEMHYMHYDDEYQLKEIQKFCYEYPDEVRRFIPNLFPTFN